MPENIDVYRIARLLINEHGIFAQDEIEEKITQFTNVGDYNAVKTWYEIEEALNEIQGVTIQKKEEPVFS